MGKAAKTGLSADRIHGFSGNQKLFGFHDTAVDQILIRGTSDNVAKHFTERILIHKELLGEEIKRNLIFIIVIDIFNNIINNFPVSNTRRCIEVVELMILSIHSQKQLRYHQLQMEFLAIAFLIGLVLYIQDLIKALLQIQRLFSSQLQDLTVFKRPEKKAFQKIYIII